MVGLSVYHQAFVVVHHIVLILNLVHVIDVINQDEVLVLVAKVTSRPRHMVLLLVFNPNVLDGAVLVQHQVASSV